MHCKLIYLARLHGILHPRILEWVAIPFSRGSSWSLIDSWESNTGLLHCRQILYCLSHQGSPRIKKRFTQLEKRKLTWLLRLKSHGRISLVLRHLFKTLFPSFVERWFLEVHSTQCPQEGQEGGCEGFLQGMVFPFLACFLVPARQYLSFFFHFYAFKCIFLWSESLAGEIAQALNFSLQT